MIGSILRIVFATRLAMMLLLLVANTATLVWTAYVLGFWESIDSDVVVLWFLGTGLVLFVNSGDAAQTPHYARHVFKQAIGASVFLNFYVNLHSFGLIAELILLPVLVFLIGIIVVSERDPELAAAEKFGNALLTMFGFFALAYVTWWTITGFTRLDFADIGRTLAVPIWLSIGTLPLFCLFRWLAACGALFLRINFEAERIEADEDAHDQPNRRRAKLAVVWVSRLRVGPLLDWERHPLRELVCAGSFLEALGLVSAHHAAVVTA